MKAQLAALLAIALCGSASAQQYASAAGDYRTCSPAQTREGIEAVTARCGTLSAPTFKTRFTSFTELQEAIAARDTLTTQVNAYGVCVTEFINSYRRPGADANSDAPDQAACAHAWAEDTVTRAVIDTGRACIDYSNRSVVDSALPDYTGSCYPDFNASRG